MSGEKPGVSLGLTQYGDEGFSLFLRKAFIKAMGYTDNALDRPIVGIVNTYSAYNACHRNVPDVIEAIKRGVMLGGGLPIEFPVISMHESFSSPTSMYLRNLMSIDTEEMIRAQPMHSVVLIGGCDKTVPALLMGAASADVPAILTVTGPMSTGSHKGVKLGACTDCRGFWAKYRADEISGEEIAEVNNKLAPTAGTCMVMGTASTMALTAEALGIMLPGGAAIPATFAERLRHAEETGAEAVRLASSGRRPKDILTKEAFTNAFRVLHAIGGSTNGLIHLTAIAGRLGIEIDLDSFDRIGQETPVLVDLKPSGQHYMEDLYKAGGLAPVLRELEPLLETEAVTVTGETLGEVIRKACFWEEQKVVHKLGEPLYPRGGLRILRGNIAPGSALIKQSAASPELIRSSGRAVVFTSLEDMARRIDSDDLNVEADDFLVLINAGPRGAPGMPEAGYIPIPRKLARQGVRDMVRISDARMSGTAYGTVVLHICPEAAVGGPLGLVRTGDQLSLDVEAGTISHHISDSELARRRAEWRPPEHFQDVRGYRRLYIEHVQQADHGCVFLTSCRRGV